MFHILDWLSSSVCSSFSDCSLCNIKTADWRVFTFPGSVQHCFQHVKTLTDHHYSLISISVSQMHNLFDLVELCWHVITRLAYTGRAANQTNSCCYLEPSWMLLYGSQIIHCLPHHSRTGQTMADRGATCWFGIVVQLGNEKWSKVCGGVVSKSGVSIQ